LVEKVFRRQPDGRLGEPAQTIAGEPHDGRRALLSFVLSLRASRRAGVRHVDSRSRSGATPMTALGRRIDSRIASRSVCQNPLWNRERPPNATGATSEALAG